MQIYNRLVSTRNVLDEQRHSKELKKSNTHSLLSCRERRSIEPTYNNVKTKQVSKYIGKS